MAYVYKGKIHDLDETPEPLTGHGTYAGYRKHQREGSPACEDCKAAQAAYSREYYERRGGRTNRKSRASLEKRGRKPVYGCGTPAGAQQHYRAGTPTCDACRRAMAEYRRNRKVAA